jgi:hypothetical protein
MTVSSTVNSPESIAEDLGWIEAGFILLYRQVRQGLNLEPPYRSSIQPAFRIRPPEEIERAHAVLYSQYPLNPQCTAMTALAAQCRCRAAEDSFGLCASHFNSLFGHKRHFTDDNSFICQWCGINNNWVRRCFKRPLTEEALAIKGNRR